MSDIIPSRPRRSTVALWAILAILNLSAGVVIASWPERQADFGTVSEALLPMLMFLTWGGFRALLEFSLLPLVCGLLSMVLADRRPMLSGSMLGLSLMKPHIAVPFFL